MPACLSEYTDPMEAGTVIVSRCVFNAQPSVSYAVGSNTE